MPTEPCGVKEWLDANGTFGEQSGMVKLAWKWLVLAIGAWVGLSASAWAMAAVPHDFSAFPTPIYRGPVTQPAFRGPQHVYEAYRTRIRASVAAGPAFAGHLAVAVIGCGTSCRFGYVTDLKTGMVYELPYGGEEYYQILYRVRPNSRLLQIQWTPYDEKAGPRGCALEDFIWTGSAFKSLGRRSAQECPDWDDYAG